MRKPILLLFLSLLSFAMQAAEVACDNIALYIFNKSKEPVDVALGYIGRDYLKVTKTPLSVERVARYGDISDNKWSIVVVDNSNTFADLPSDIRNKVKGWESHRLWVDAAHKKIFVQGDDMRGTIFALYAFSEKILGIPPLWFWASFVPKQKTTLSFDDSLDIFFAPPAVKYRAFFPNDTDLYTPFIKISDETMNIWAETAMRLKMNATEQNTVFNIVTRELTDVGKTIKRHGMVLTSHHQTILGVEFSKWDDYWVKVKGMTKAPEFKLGDEKQLFEFWRYSIKAIHDSGIENVWTVGLRGNGDRPFWSITFSDSPKEPKERAEVLNKLIPKQIELIREVTGHNNFEMRTILYNEMAELFADGYFTPPTPDNMILTFSALRQDPIPNRDIVGFKPSSHTRIGYYMNLQFYTTGCHLSQGEGPWKMEGNYRYVMGKENTRLDYSVLNLGNLREFYLTCAANAQMLWSPQAYSTDKFMNEFCSTYFTEAYAPQAIKLYKEFFDAFWQQKKDSPEFPDLKRQYIYQDLRIRFSIMKFCEIFSQPTISRPLTDVAGRSYRIEPKDNNAGNQLDAVINGMTASVERWKSVTAGCDALYESMPEANRAFFNDNLRTMAHFMHQISIAFLNSAIAYKNKDDNAVAAECFDKGYQAMGKAKKYIYEAQHGIFSNWYAGDASPSGKFNIPLVEKRLLDMRDSLQRPYIIKCDTLYPIADSYTSCFGNDDYNYGRDKYLKVSRNNGRTAEKYNSYIKFDLKTINASGAEVIGAQLGLYKSADGLKTERRVNIAVTKDIYWTEEEVSGKYRGAYPQMTNTSTFFYFTKREGAPAQWYKVQSTPISNSGLYKAVTEAMAESAKKISFRIYPDDNTPPTDDRDAINFHSKENKTNRPYLIIESKQYIETNSK